MADVNKLFPRPPVRCSLEDDCNNNLPHHIYLKTFSFWSAHLLSFCLPKQCCHSHFKSSWMMDGSTWQWESCKQDRCTFVECKASGKRPAFLIVNAVDDTVDLVRSSFFLGSSFISWTLKLFSKEKGIVLAKIIYTDVLAGVSNDLKNTDPIRDRIWWRPKWKFPLDDASRINTVDEHLCSIEKYRATGVIGKFHK